MIRSIYRLLLCGLLSFGGFTLFAQDKENSTPEDKAINTKQKTPVKIIEYIVGTWKINDNGSASNASPDTRNSGLGTTIKFNRENQYVMSANQQQIDSGTFRLNEDHAILYLESASGNAPVEWNVSFKKNVMTLTPRETSAQAKNDKYIYSRTGPGGHN